MMMLSFRVDEEDAVEAQRWADRLGIDRSELLRDALRRQLARLASELDAEASAQMPLTESEGALAEIAGQRPRARQAVVSTPRNTLAGSDGGGLSQACRRNELLSAPR
jgi:hypothetical protein